MDPLMEAAGHFMEDIAAFLRGDARSVRIVCAPEDRTNVIQALRLVERAPENRYPFILYEEPFGKHGAYFEGLTAKVAADYEQIRAGVGAEGIELPELRPLPGGDALTRAAITVGAAAELLGGRGLLAGLLVGLLPRHIIDADGYRAAMRAWMARSLPQYVRLAVQDSVGELRGERVARFMAAPRSRPTSPEVPPLHAALVDAKTATEAGDHGRAAAALRRAVGICQAQGLAAERAAVMLALAGALLSGGDREGARGVFLGAAKLAEAVGGEAIAAQAWMAVATLAALEGMRDAAEVALRAADAAAERGGLAAIREQVARLRGR